MRKKYNLFIFLCLIISITYIVGCSKVSTPKTISKSQTAVTTPAENTSKNTPTQSWAQTSTETKKETPTQPAPQQAPAPEPVKPKVINQNPSSNPVNNIVSSQSSAQITTQPTSTVNASDELFKIIENNLLAAKDTVVNINDSSLRNSIGSKAIEIAEKTGYSGYITNTEYSVQGNTVSIHFNYKDGKDVFLTKINKVNSKVQSIISSLVKPGMNNFQKELVLHDYLVNNTKYDIQNLNNGSILEDDYTAYGALINGTAVCEGYAEAMHRLLTQAKINDIIVDGNGNGTPHAWNIVNIDGAYYHLDATFDDPVSSSGDTLCYNYFNIDDKQILKDHSFDSSKYPPCTSTNANYFAYNNLVANSNEQFYNIILNGIKNKQTIIRCKTYVYDVKTSPQIIQEILYKNPTINYINTSSGYSYSYSDNSQVVEFYLKYK